MGQADEAVEHIVEISAVVPSRLARQTYGSVPVKLEECGGLLVDLNFQNMVEASEQMQPQQAESQDFALIMIILMGCIGPTHSVPSSVQKGKNLAVTKRVARRACL
eukprot:1159573-Pelagomonas_calceolata.AAC.1